MKELQELREMLCDELKEYGKKGELSAGTLDVIDKLTHALKNLDKVMEEDGYSGTYDDGRSYARNNMRRRYSRDGYPRDGYSRDGGLVEQLREMMREAPEARQDFQRLISKIESM
jgi:hypothetical protein